MLISNNFDVQNDLQRELLSDEKLLWSGKPKSGFLFRRSDILFIPFSIIWCGFVIFWESMAISNRAPFFFALWGIPFFCVGLYITVGRFFYDKKNRNNTVYGITANRIIIKSGVFKTTTESFNIKTLPDTSIDEKSDGSGTIKLGQDRQFLFEVNGLDQRNQRKAPALEFIQDVRSVYNLILQQQN
ncbi:MAG TPA: hypothetical protein VGI43_18075 [Mucilaginibacter sp.]|jgi:hypothetical protein